jgi:hypothetical protein
MPDPETPDLTRTLNLLQSENRSDRRKALSGIHSEVMRSGWAEEGAPLLPPLIRLLSDPVERTRELSTTLLASAFEAIPLKDLSALLPTLIPVLSLRLGSPELVEGSEEVRLVGIQLLKVLVERVGGEKGSLGPYLDDLLLILANAILDPFHSVRIEASGLVCILAEYTREIFHYNSERLLRPLALAVTHQQWKVRVAVLKCIGE